MEAEDDIEDGEILEEDESNSNEPTFPNKELPIIPNNKDYPMPIPNKDYPMPIANKDYSAFDSFEQKIHFEVKNTFEEYFAQQKEKRNHHHESHKNSRRDRSSFSDIPRKRRRMDDDDGCIRNDKMYYEKNNKSNYDGSGMKNYDDEGSDDEMIFVLGGSLKDTEKRHTRPMRNDMPPEFSNNLNDPMMYPNEVYPNEDENEDSRPYHKRSPLRKDTYKKDRTRSRGFPDRGPDRGFDRGPDRNFDKCSDRGPDRGPERCQVGMMKRRGRGGGIGGRGGGEMLRKGKPRDRDDNDSCSFYNQGKNQRGNESMYSHQYNNMPRKLEVCKFYLNDNCTKRDRCIYMHNDFPCKYHHTPGLTCHLKNCKFSHSKLDEIQRAVLKKYADIPCKEIDDQQRFHRENSGNSTYSAHKEKRETANANNLNSRIPSLFEVKIPVPPEYRADDEEGGGSTPMPSPQSASQLYDDDESDVIYNDRHTETTSDGDDTDRKLSNEDHSHKSHHRKKSKKGDDYNSDGEKRKHSEKRKKHSKKEDRKSEKKKKHAQKPVDNTYADMFPELDEPPWDIDFDKEDEPKDQASNAAAESAAVSTAAAISTTTTTTTTGTTTISTLSPANVDGDRSPKYDQKESDALSHLPKKQQELFLRIQQHQKEAEASQNAKLNEKEDEEDTKPDVNWYSSDEEESEKPENSSALDTILRTIKTNSNNVPNDKKSDTSNPVDTYLPATSSTTPPPPTVETDSVVVDASQLANINLSDEVTQLLTSIMKTDASTSSQPAPPSETLPSNGDKDDRPFSQTRKLSEDKSYQVERPAANVVPPPKEDVDLRYFNANSILNTASLFASNSEESNPNNDIDFRTLPFKPVPIHDAATEINASITSHPPMEYKLKPLSFISRVNYASMTDVAKVCTNDPRFKRKIMNAPNAENVENSHVIPPTSLPHDPRQALPLKTMNEAHRIDPRLADPRKMDRFDPRFDTKNSIPNPKLDQRPDPRMMEPKMPDKEQVHSIIDFRDPRLKSCVFPEMPMPPFPMMPPPMMPEMMPMPVRKEDPRLKYRANQK